MWTSSETFASIKVYRGNDKEIISAFEAVVDGKYTLSDGKLFSARFVYDALTGASANGAVPSTGIQTFTRPKAWHLRSA